MDLFDRIMELCSSGYCCSQVLAKLLLETIGEENPGFVKAMDGLKAGIGSSGGCCGCMTGGACIISYLTGKDTDDGQAHPEHQSAMSEFTEWFRETVTADYGGTDCRVIIKDDPANKIEYCPHIMAETYAKCMEILSERNLI